VQCLRLFEAGIVELLISDIILLEIQDVLTRPKIQAKFTQLTPELINTLLTVLADKATLIANVPEHFVYARDPKDERYLNLVIEAKPDYLVTYDDDLCDLVDEKNSDARKFQILAPAVKILRPGAFLREVLPSSS